MAGGLRYGEYWVQIQQGGAALGAGFFITERYVLTARHCLRLIDPDDSTLDLRCADGETVQARVRSPTNRASFPTTS